MTAKSKASNTGLTNVSVYGESFGNLLVLSVPWR